jgi:hypothetical protein
MAIQFAVDDIAHLIQLSVAPVFLLTGLGGVLSVLTIRINRIVDRARHLEERYAACKDPAHKARQGADLRTLARRLRLTGWAITLCMACELLICTLIALLFVGGVFRSDVSLAIAIIFIVAMFLLILGLLFFLYDIYVGMRSIRIGMPADIRGPEDGESR